jgi:hypothetical protein
MPQCGIRDNSISCSLLSIINKGAAINKPTVVSLRNNALLHVIWARKELSQCFRAGVNQGCWGERKKGGQVKWRTRDERYCGILNQGHLEGQDTRGGHGVKSLICKKLQEAMRGVNSKGGPKGELFTFLN